MTSRPTNFCTSCILLLLVAIVVLVAHPVQAQQTLPSEPSLPVFVDGQAQVVQGFADSGMWIRHDLWVETEFDSDGDGRPDRVHADVTRAAQTDSEGLRVPIVYESSPYYSGVGTAE
jgi:X-Pro dipeptidyl-peptidase